MAKPIDQNKLTAHHEAGHAVIAIAVGRSVNKVSIIAKNTKLGVCKMKKGRAKASQDVLEGELLILLAGMAAESRISGRYNLQGAAQDLRDAERLAMMRAGNERQAGKTIKRALDKVQNMLSQKDTWAAVKAVAKDLIEKEEISGRAAVHHVEQAKLKWVSKALI